MNKCYETKKERTNFLRKKYMYETKEERIHMSCCIYEVVYV